MKIYEINIGDKFSCIRDYSDPFYGWFSVNKCYYINSMTKGYVYIMDDNFNNIIFSDSEFSDSFINVRELRKLKLDKINESR